MSGETHACHLLPSSLTLYEPSLTEDTFDRCLRSAVDLVSIKKILQYSTAGQEVTAQQVLAQMIPSYSWPPITSIAWPHEPEIGLPGYCGPAEKEAMGRG